MPDIEFGAIQVTDIFAPVAILFSASIAVIIASVQLKVQRRIARDRLTWDMLFREDTDPDIIKLRKLFYEIISDESRLNLIDIERNKYSDDAWIVIQSLNRYELLAQGVTCGILDEKLAFDYLGSVLVRDYYSCADVLTKWRKQLDQPDLFVFFQKVALRWRKHRRK